MHGHGGSAVCEYFSRDVTTRDLSFTQAGGAASCALQCGKRRPLIPERTEDAWPQKALRTQGCQEADAKSGRRSNKQPGHMTQPGACCRRLEGVVRVFDNCTSNQVHGTIHLKLAQSHCTLTDTLLARRQKKKCFVYFS